MNYRSMGLPEAHGQNAFTACVPRSTNITEHIAPLNPEERKAALIAFKKSIVSFSPNPQADSDNTAKISGRANGRRTQ